MEEDVNLALVNGKLLMQHFLSKLKMYTDELKKKIIFTTKKKPKYQMKF
jgi:hypothetical protein